MQIDIDMKKCIIEDFEPVLKDIFGHKYSRYILPGGRGSTKSSMIGGIAIPMLLTIYPNIHAVCFRKIANTIQTSVFPQVIWGIYQLGLQDYFKIPKNYSTPIEYIPTGQRIYFMGLDDPNKVKSIKVPFGYIAINWFEELDQYSGEKELRKVTQSTKRGGQLFWDFRTFNPPISKNNWANEYVESFDIKPNKNTMIIRSTYLQVPQEWLGPEFIEEAEELKERDYKAYEHEYLGIPVGTGGDVFPNVVDLDMEQKVTIGDREVPLYETFDHIYHGIDWGFAIDPTRYVKLHFDRRAHDIYIFDEYNTVKSRIIDIYNALYEESKLLTPNDEVIADPGGGGLFAIADFKAYGAFIRAADKGPDSVNYGIKWLQGLNHIYIDKRRCPETWTEFSTYEYEQDKDGNFINVYPDENNHSIDACRYALQKYANRKGN